MSRKRLGQGRNKNQNDGAGAAFKTEFTCGSSVGIAADHLQRHLSSTFVFFTQQVQYHFA
jgi:hypothetical protein